MSNKKSRIYQKQASEIRNRLNGRDYILGLDLGVGSIGSAVVAIDEINGVKMPADVVYAGSRIFPSSQGAAERRDHRGQRNSLRHRKNRLKWLWKVLGEKGLMLPYVVASEDISDPAVLRFSKETRRHDPYTIRYKGLSEEISLEDLGYALYHIANHRGSSSVFASVETKNKKSSNDSKYAEAKSITDEVFKKYSCNTFIELLYCFNKDKESFVARNTDSKTSRECTPMPTRDLIEAELDKLLDKQKAFHPEILDDDYIKRIKEAVLYENDMLVPESGNCPFFPNEKRLPKYALINEERRLWEAVNNISFTIINEDEEGEIRYKYKQKLDDERRQKCFDDLYNGLTLKTQNIKNLYSDYELQDIKLQGSDKKIQEIVGFRCCKIRNNNFYSQLLEEDKVLVMREWANSVSKDDFANRINKKFTIDDSTIDQLISDLPNNASGGYAQCGLSAMRILIKYIKEDRLSYNEAIYKAIEEGKLPVDNSIRRGLDNLPYYGKVIPNSIQMLMGKSWHSKFSERLNSPSFNRPNTNSDEDKYGKIANPVVHQTLNELRKLVNELIEILGKKPSFVKIETARELKIGQEKRELLALEMAGKQKNNQRIYDEYCKINDLDGKKYIKRFRIWENQKNICPYCLKTITTDQIAEGNADLDHIFPRSDVPGNPENNLVMGHKNCNEKLKGDKIPYEAFHSDTEQWKKILQNVSTNIHDKEWRFTMTTEEYQKWKETHGMISRFKTDNAYISTVAREYLSSLYCEEGLKHKVVDTIKGSNTALLRKAWNVESLTTDLAAKLDSSILTDDVNDMKKNRLDVRHHALDAIVIAYSNPSIVQKVNTLNAYGIDYDAIQSQLKIPTYYALKSGVPDFYRQRIYFRDEIKNVLETKTFISRKIDHSPNGELLKGTSYSVYATKGENIVYCCNKKVSEIKVGKDLKQSKELDVVQELTKELSKNLFIDFKIPQWATSDESYRISSAINENKKILDSVVEHLSIAKQMLLDENEKASSSGKKTKSIDEKAIFTRALTLVGGKYHQLNNGTLSKMFMTRKPHGNMVGNIYDTGSNYCIDFYFKDDKLTGEVIRKIDIIDSNYIPKYVKSGYQLFERVYPYDILEIEKFSGESPYTSFDKVSSIIVPNARFDRSFVAITTFTTIGDGNNIQIFIDSLANSHPKQATSFTVNSMKKTKPRVVTLSSAGLVKYVSKPLVDPCGE